MAEDARVVILFGTQTGNSQDVAERIGREAKARRLRAVVMAMDAYDVRHLPNESLVIFVAATTGQGELPSSMKQFWRFLLRKSLPPESLSNLHYATFGLGDSGYVHYNVVAKKLDRRVAALGGQHVINLGLGDDQHPSGYEAALDPWLAQLWSALHAQHLLHNGTAQASLDPSAVPLEPKYKVQYLDKPPRPVNGISAQSELEEAAAAARLFGQVEACVAGTSGRTADAAADGTGFGPWQPYMAKMLKNERITARDHFQDTRHIELDLGGSKLAYEPGDLLAVFPQQPPAAVRDFMHRLGLDADAFVRIEAADPINAAQTDAVEVKIGALVAGVMDVAGASPRRFFFEVLRHFASKQMEADRLAYFASAEGRDDLSRYNHREGRTVLEVLQDFESASPPLEWLLQVVPRLQPRLFSIASSPRAHPGQAHITAAVVDYLTPNKRRRKGLCTAWLAQLQPGALLPVWVESGTMRLPKSLQTPMILVGPGTGVAPFRAFLEERLLASASAPFAGSLLFFGCRNEHGDFYYREFWAQCQEAGLLIQPTGLFTAFSRDQARKIYVQDRIRETAPQIWAALQQGAVVYICGSAKRMPQDVAAAFQQVLMKEGGMDKMEAGRYMKQLELKGRYAVEAWS